MKILHLLTNGDVTSALMNAEVLGALVKMYCIVSVLRNLGFILIVYLENIFRIRCYFLLIVLL